MEIGGTGGGQTNPRAEEIRHTLQRRRDASLVFHSVIQEHYKLLCKVRELDIQCRQLEKIQAEFQSENETLTLSLQDARRQLATQAAQEAVQADVQKLKEETLRLYQEKEKVVSEKDALAEQLDIVRDTCSRQIDEIQTVVSKRDDLQETIDGLRKELKTLQEANSASGEEMARRIQSDEDALKKVEALTVENNDLIARIVHLKDQEAQKMNEMNVLREKIIADAKVQASEIIAEAKQKSKQSARKTDEGIALEAGEDEGNIVPVRVKARFEKVHPGGCTAIASDLGMILATCGLDKVVRLWDPVSLKETACLRGSHATVNDVAVTSDSRLILGAEDHQAVRLWDAKSFRMINMSLTGHLGKVTGVSTYPSDAKQAASCATDRSIKVWKLDRGLCSRTIPFTSTAKRINVLSDAGLIVTCHFDGRLRFWDVREKSVSPARVVDAHPSKEICGMHSLTTSNMTCSVGKDNYISLIDTRTFKSLGRFGHPNLHVDSIGQPGISPSGGYISAGSKDGSVFIWSVASSEMTKPTKILKGHEHSVVASAWLPVSAEPFVTADRHGTVSFWTCST
ncbi:Autophagy-related protein 16 [Picochlorum sp. SENEW3]|nr:Autophagy-related protein 16 [Picochlorum sp. SENEW3]